MRTKFFLERLVGVFVIIAEIILGLRIFFRLFNANPTASFVDWIYSTSDALMVPFRGIFPAAELQRGIVLDISAIFAAIMYLAIGYLLIALIDLVPTRDREVVASDERPVKRKRRA